jgi:hypothetical protein
MSLRETLSIHVTSSLLKEIRVFSRNLFEGSYSMLFDQNDVKDRYFVAPIVSYQRKHSILVRQNYLCDFGSLILLFQIEKIHEQRGRGFQNSCLRRVS